MDDFRRLVDRLDDPAGRAAVIDSAQRFRLYGDVIRALPSRRAA
jgi:hypothetical protein